ncbi:MAG TPA: hypothetical protein VHM94_11150 [Acidimicrobiia bacterium]|nr:hypothetical protein [Acidimicrobiia bacterium]
MVEPDKRDSTGISMVVIVLSAIVLLLVLALVAFLLLSGYWGGTAINTTFSEVSQVSGS